MFDDKNLLATSLLQLTTVVWVVLQGFRGYVLHRQLRMLREMVTYPDEVRPFMSTEQYQLTRHYGIAKTTAAMLMHFFIFFFSNAADLVRSKILQLTTKLIKIT